MPSRTLASLLRPWIVSLLVAMVAGCGGGGGGGGGGSTYKVGGTVSGLGSSGLVLQLNGGNDLAVPADGPFTFAPIADGSAYTVSVFTQPQSGKCTVDAGATGTLAGANVSDVAISCTKLVGGAIQGKALTLTGAVSTLVGSALTQLDGIGTAARFAELRAAAIDGAYLYVIDKKILRRITLATGEVTTLTTSSPFNLPFDMVAVGGNLYVTDTYSIVKVNPTTGSVTPFAGDLNTAAYVDGTGTAARFGNPRNGLTTDGMNLYVGDGGHLVRKVVIATGEVTTFAGTTGVSGYVNGTGTAAQFNGLTDLVYLNGALYATETSNHMIRRIDVASKAVTHFSGSGTADTTDGDAATATFANPHTIATDGSSLYVFDQSNFSVRAVDGGGAVTTLVAGNGYVNGVGTAARVMYLPAMLAVADTLYLIEMSGTVRRLDTAANAVTSFVGVGPGVDGTGVAADVAPDKVTTDGTHLYVAESNSATIRKVVIATGEVTTLAGAYGVRGTVDGMGAAARFDGPAGITTDGTNLYVADCSANTIRQVVIATGEVTTLAGDGNVAGALVDGVGGAARFDCPYGITTDGTHLYVAEGSNAIRKIVIATGKVTTLAGSSNSGYLDGVGTDALFNWPEGLTTDGTNLYVVEDNHTVRKIVIATGEVTTLAGQAGVGSNADGIGTDASFNSPYDVTTDGTYLYVADGGGQSVRKVEIATGAVTTLAGSPTMASGFVDGSGTEARFCTPNGITTDGESLFVSDNCNRALRVIK